MISFILGTWQGACLERRNVCSLKANQRTDRRHLLVVVSDPKKINQKGCFKDGSARSVCCAKVTILLECETVSWELQF